MKRKKEREREKNKLLKFEFSQLHNFFARNALAGGELVKLLLSHLFGRKGTGLVGVLMITIVI